MSQGWLQVAAPILGLPLLMGAWATLIEPRLIQFEHEVGVVPGLPAVWRGKQIALLGDLHAGMPLGNTSTVRRAVARIIRARPALALLTGDFLFQPLPRLDETIRVAADLVAPLPAAGIPTYSVLGNHDYASDQVEDDRAGKQIAKRLTRALEEVGVQVLQDEVVALQPPSQRTSTEASDGEAEAWLHLVGLAPYAPAEGDPRAAISRLASHIPRLVLTHHPESFRELPAGTAPLALAGHTHGGQIRVPFKPDWSGAIITGSEVRRDGWIDGYGQAGNRLYVNRGIGMSLAPIRLFCRPAVTFFTLERGDLTP